MADEDMPAPPPESGRPSELVIRLGGGEAELAGIEGKYLMGALVMQNVHPIGFHLRVNMEFRITGMRVAEGKTKATAGQVVLQEELTLVSAREVCAFDPAEAADTVGGSASAHAIPSAQDAADLGVQFRRSSDLWEPT